MASLGIHLGADLRSKSLHFLAQHFGKSAEYLHHAARGIDHRQVKPNRVRKSVGREQTYSEDLIANAALHDALEHIIDSVWLRIEKSVVVGRTVTLKVKYADFRQITRSQSTDAYIVDKAQFAALARAQLDQVLPVQNGVRLLGLTLSGLAERTARQASQPVVRMIQEQRVFDY
jgi:DNA polymerase-4